MMRITFAANPFCFTLEGGVLLLLLFLRPAIGKGGGENEDWDGSHARESTVINMCQAETCWRDDPLGRVNVC